MFLSIEAILKKLFSSGSEERDRYIAELKANDHAYVRGNINGRGPCPGLNALANQGYLPRDGRKITVPQVEAALMTALHMNSRLAGALGHSLKPLIRKDGTFDLIDMREHDVIEHDASFTRLDFHQGDNYTFQSDMFEAMLNDADGGPVTIKSLAKTYKRRNRESIKDGAPGLPLKLKIVNLIQTVSLMNTAQTGGMLSRELMTEFYTHERFPAVVMENLTTRTLGGLLGKAAELLWHILT